MVAQLLGSSDGRGQDVEGGLVTPEMNWKKKVEKLLNYWVLFNATSISNFSLVYFKGKTTYCRKSFGRNTFTLRFYSSVLQFLQKPKLQFTWRQIQT